MSSRGTPDWCYDPNRWIVLLGDMNRLLDKHGDALVSLGWTETEVFGCHPVAPEARYDCAGLILSLRGREILMVTDINATIRCSDGNVLVYRRGVGKETVLMCDEERPPERGAA